MDEMNQSEVLRDETEQKMIFKFLLMIEEERKNQGSLDTLEQKLKTLAK